MRPFFAFIFIFCFLKITPQTGTQNPFQNQVILQHYDSLELASIQETDLSTFNSICYYYTQSYIFETVGDCNCTPMPAAAFDITQYEYLRKRNVRAERYFEKYGFKLTLLSINELQYKLPIHTP